MDDKQHRVIHEVTPLVGSDILYIADRHKMEFTYPIHNHEVFELNFVANASGMRRIVGDSQEVIGDYDLVLITSPKLEHVWELYHCKSEDIREITIQFDLDFETDSLLNRNPYKSIRLMMEKAKRGLCFPLSAIVGVYSLLDKISSIKDGFYSVNQFLTILYELSKCDTARMLSSSSDAKVAMETDSCIIMTIKDYIANHYTEDLRLALLADMAGMAPSAFSRFFKAHTGTTLSDYIIDMRLSKSSRLLLDTNKSVNEICTECGFNNLSNFNRIFKKKKNCSPSEFRENYHKTRVII
ncbi:MULTISPECIES: AraC family transcriptional regulator [Segatella]|jgi:AraC-like DNA-binding protein|uniref:Transcriptional regulator, AraC family n=2 Tax=Segatella TaxID=2974251 RepID=D8DWI2_9BACT|nr:MULTISPECIES: AraC family transcriptional regulator [Segatella]MBQ3857748.1 helix-turn-helix domain-containing protein [Prevotella sp.]EFI72242.1 transcriptional regulator, AraC family [Segatella baroniae B14]MDR4930773.1 AraC family transcriptional regulator [Segatella bryantii]MEE3414581.1 AraC family transcriptional regulator [Prevotella sp.]OYP53462.1 AraC family transcriptional regulator [Segatella bryantii]